ncbi:hypothetical protein KEM56_006330 [Ascosphaera pollenicola]|nr:hypothetical protein KEM56_006330 [Ascosphaera pollenicola]
MHGSQLDFVDVPTPEEPIKYPKTGPRVVRDFAYIDGGPSQGERMLHISTDGNEVQIAETIDIRLLSTTDPILDINLIHVPILQLSFDDLRRVVQDRIETHPYDDRGTGQEVPLDKIHLFWNKLPVTSKMVTDVLGDEVSILLEGGLMQFGVKVEGDTWRKKNPNLFYYTVVLGAPGNDEDGEDDEEDRPVRLDPAQRAEIAKEKLPDMFWENLHRFVENQLGKESTLAPDRVVEVFRESWRQRDYA